MTWIHFFVQNKVLKHKFLLKKPEPLNILASELKRPRIVTAFYIFNIDRRVCIFSYENYMEIV
jgi:hypothetical protein